MGTKKTICIILVTVLGLSLFATGVGARASCDGEPCRHHNMLASRQISIAEKAFLSKKCCPEPQKNPCDFEKNLHSNVHECALPVSSTLTKYPKFGSLVAFNNPIETQLLTGFGRKPRVNAAAPSTPIYLKNLSLIC